MFIVAAAASVLVVLVIVVSQLGSTGEDEHPTLVGNHPDVKSALPTRTSSAVSAGPSSTAVPPASLPSPSRPPSVPTTASSPVESATWPASATDEQLRARRHWLTVLWVIDLQRESAWRQGRPRLLSRVYTAGSAALRADRRMLDQYLGRGLRVSGVSLRFMSLRVAQRHRRSVSLLVVDRVGASVAVDHSGHREVLPRDQPTRHRIDLRKVDHTWRIARISLA